MIGTWNVLVFGVTVQTGVTYFFSAMISAIKVLITPTLLFNTPPRVRKTIADVNDRENPKPKHEIHVPRRPIRRTLLRPIHSASASRPHQTAVRNWAAVKLPCIIPACAEIAESGKDGSNDLS